MPFTNGRFGFLTKPFTKSLFVFSDDDGSSPPPPPTQCFLAIQVTSGILAIQVTSGDLLVHCPSEELFLVDYLGNQYANYEGDEYIEVQP